MVNLVPGGEPAAPGGAPGVRPGLAGPQALPPGTVPQAVGPEPGVPRVSVTVAGQMTTPHAASVAVEAQLRVGSPLPPVAGVPTADPVLPSPVMRADPPAGLPAPGPLPGPPGFPPPAASPVPVTPESAPVSRSEAITPQASPAATNAPVALPSRPEVPSPAQVSSPPASDPSLPAASPTPGAPPAAQTPGSPATQGVIAAAMAASGTARPVGGLPTPGPMTSALTNPAPGGLPATPPGVVLGGGIGEPAPLARFITVTPGALPHGAAAVATPDADGLGPARAPLGVPAANDPEALWRPPGHPGALPLALPVLIAILPGLAAIRAARQGRVRQAPFRRSRPEPRGESGAELWLAAQRAAEAVAWTDRRPVPLDLAPATPHVPVWRLDDTTALVLAGTRRDLARSRAEALHAALMAGAPPLAALRAEEGVRTWEGSPLWLRLAGIEKPASLGILLAETEPAEIEILRETEDRWVASRRLPGAAHRLVWRLAGPSADPALRDGLLFGPGKAPRLREAQSRLASCRALPSPSRWRHEEAWGAVLRRLAWSDDDLAALAAGDGETITRLARQGEAVLGVVCEGEVEGITAQGGLALAAALGRLEGVS